MSLQVNAEGEQPLPVPTLVTTEIDYLTPKLDYAPSETVYIVGTGFAGNTRIVVSVQRPDGVTTTSDDVIVGDYAVDITSNPNHLTSAEGTFTATYQLDGIEGTYIVTATDGTNTATTTFTDYSYLINSVSVGAQDPDPVAIGSSATYPISSTWTSGYAVGSSATLSITGWDSVPAGISITFSPASISQSSSTSSLTIDTSASTASGTYTFTVRARQQWYWFFGWIYRDRTATGTLVVQAADTTPPTGSIIVNSGDTYTPSTGVTLSLTYADASGVSEVRYSNDGVWDTETWESPAATKAWVLPSGSGTKTVYYQVKDNAGLTSVFSDSIVLDMTAPTVALTIESGDAYTGNRFVFLGISASDSGSGVGEMRLRNSGESWSSWVAFDSFVSWELATGSDGSRTVDCEVRDNVLNTGSDSDSITLDTTNPIVSISSPTSGEWFGWGSVYSNGWASDGGSGVDLVRYRVDGGDWTDTGDTTSWSFSVSSLSEGSHTIGVRAYDEVGNYGSDSVTINVDKTNPAVSITSPANNAWVTTSTPTISGTSSDGGSGIDEVEVSVDGGGYSLATGMAPWSFITGSLAEGSHTVTARATDAAGNTATHQITIKVDTIAPTVTIAISDPVISEADAGGTFTITATFSEPMNKAVYPGPGTGFVPPVTATLTSPVFAWNTAGTAFTVSYTIVDANVEVPDVDVSVAGCKDPAGNLMVPNTLVDALDIDTVAPSISGAATTLPNANGWYKTDVTVHFTASDGMGIASVTPDTTLTVEGAGQHVLGTAIDWVGNSATFDVTGINIDKTAPSITGSRTPAANGFGWNSVDVTVSFATSDGLSGVDPLNDPADVTVSTEGAGQSVTGTVYDQAGNSASDTISNINIDKTAPTLSKSLAGTVGLDNWYITDVVVTLTGGDAASGLDFVQYNLNSDGWTLYAGPFTISTEGYNTLEHKATDKAGNVYVLATQTIKVDNSDPEVEITSPSDGAYFNIGTVDVTGTASDGAFVLKVEVKVDVGSFADATPGGVGDWSTWSFTTGSLSVGTHTITAKVTDVGGTTAETSVDVIVGATSLTYTGDLSGQYSDPVTVSATLIDMATGNGISGKSTTFTIGALSASATTDANGDASTTITLNQASGSYNVLSSFAGDSSYGSSSDSDTFTINKETATITYTGDTYVFTAGPTITTAPVRLSATVTQESDGYLGDLALATVTFFIDGNYADGKPFQKTVGNVPVNSAGEALATVNVPAGAYIVTVDIETANAYWETDIDATDLIVETGTGKQMVTGGGWIPYEESTNGKINFGFTVQYQKTGAPKGSFVAVFRSTDGYIYKIKSTSWSKGGLSFTAVDKAFFTATCVVQKIDRATGEVVESWGNYKVLVQITDSDYRLPQNGRADTIAIAVLDRTGGIWRQFGTSTSQTTLGGGSIVVRSK